jgi:hypothetical protein
VFLGDAGNDRFLNIGLSDVFVGGEGSDAAILQGGKPNDLQILSSAETDSALREQTGTTGSFLRIQTSANQFFYVSEVEYLEFAGDGTRIDLTSFYSAAVL